MARSGDIMTTLALLAADYHEAARQLADLDLPPEVVADTLESLSGDLETKAQAVAYMVRSLEADAAAVAQWAKDAAARSKAIEARAESLREYLSRTLQACGIQRVSGPGISLSFRKSSAVVVDEIDLIPAAFMVQPPTPEAYPGKAAIAAAIKAGQDVPGAHLDTRQNLQIK